MKEEFIKVTSYEGEGYKPLVDFKAWRCAVLRHCEDTEIENIKTMQKHNETDELFILLEGECILYTGGKGKMVSEIDAIKLEPLKIYNVKQGVFHNHTLVENTTVLIVENSDTDDDNSPVVDLTTEQVEQLRKYARQV